MVEKAQLEIRCNAFPIRAAKGWNELPKSVKGSTSINGFKCTYNRREKNKAGYTANTSCGRVGRGGNARFHTFRLVFTDGRTDGRTDGWTDKGSYRVACPQLKRT